MDNTTVKRYLPWVVATTLFMEQLDSTIVNTAVPAMAESLHVEPLSLKAVVASYILSLAVCIPISGWMADRFGTRRVFGTAVTVFTVSSLLCGLSLNVTMLVAARILQGMGAAMMMPVGRLTIIRTFPKAELLRAMNFVIIPALIGPLLGPTIGGLIVHWLPWRIIFFINIPVGIAALLLIHLHMPDYRGDGRRPLDVIGLVLFGAGTSLLSWLLEVFGDHDIGAVPAAFVLLASLGLLAAYVGHAKRMRFPLLRLALFRVRTFRVSVAGGFITRLCLGGLPFLLPLLYQVGLGYPAWESGLLLMPAAAAAMGMKLISIGMLRRFGFRNDTDRQYAADGWHDRHVRPGWFRNTDHTDRASGSDPGIFQFAAILEHECHGLCRHRRIRLEHGQHNRQFHAADGEKFWSGLWNSDSCLVSGRSSPKRSGGRHSGVALCLSDIGRTDNDFFAVVLDIAGHRWRECQQGRDRRVTT